MLVDEELTRKIIKIIGAAVEVHKNIGPGLLESAYEACLCWELDYRGLKYQRQVPLPVVFKGVSLECGYRMDVVVDDRVVVEVKSIETLGPIHEAQLMTYLRLSKKRVGLLINFNCILLRDGILRRVI